MAELAKRIAGLAPDKRKAFEQLLAARNLSTAMLTTAPEPEAAPPRLKPVEPEPPIEGEKGKTRHFYNEVNEQLNPTEFGNFSFFLNYGYVATRAPQHAVVDLPEQYLNRNSVKLVLELIGDCPVEGRRMLDVGCGRGGALYVLRTFFRPREMVGLDLSSSAIAFCRATHTFPGVSFIEGDAEKLPFLDGSFDVVTNIESSHLYPDVSSFYAEVFRVLTSSGYFLYTDLLSAERMRQTAAWLKKPGFVIERDQDITANVMLSCDQIAATRLEVFDPGKAAEMYEFLGAPGSQVYEDMKHRRCAYRMFRLRKSG